MCGSITVVVYANRLIKALYWLLMHTIGDDKLAFFGSLVSVCGVWCVVCWLLSYDCNPFWKLKISITNFNRSVCDKTYLYCRLHVYFGLDLIAQL